ncbi:hypothetical protein HMPREF9419_2033 [Prevotella nigrescens ATCC 33563]|nr:hypothetical protein HMPREF9419_2033 [Prevotella nigrescens ATCC 33563]
MFHGGLERTGSTEVMVSFRHSAPIGTLSEVDIPACSKVFAAM